MPPADKARVASNSGVVAGPMARERSEEHRCPVARCLCASELRNLTRRAATRTESQSGSLLWRRFAPTGATQFAIAPTGRDPR